MNIIFTVLAAFPIGFFVRKRAIAVTAYVAADAFVFCFQTVGVLLDWMAGKKGIGGADGFGSTPTELPLSYKSSELYAYGAVNLVILLVGIGAAVLGTVVARKRARDVVAVG